MGSLLAAPLPSAETIMIADMEAGLEHLSLQTTAAADVMLVVIEPYFQSMETGAYAYQMAVEMAIPRVYTIFNKVRNQEQQEKLEAFCSSRKMGVAAVIPYDPELVNAAHVAAAPMDIVPNSQAVASIIKLVTLLEVDQTLI